MRRTMTFRLALLGTAAAAALAAGSTAARQGASRPPIPERFTNLKVLPAGIARRELVETMKGFSRSLGVRCHHCHAGEGDDLSTYDFASDVKPAKQTARLMLRMVAAINAEHLAGLPAREGSSEPARVLCVTCHRGAARPSIDPPAPAPPS
ncbi:MAG TPA: c-type cytochrome [Candidatus Polarisedimenticolia bacterium]|nr:c-type cytochrome [Candidatus Polarisedimenticolia bacterium]